MINKLTDKSTFVHLALITIIILGSFSPVLKASFLNWDDNDHIQENPQTARLSLENTLEIFRSSVLGTYIPLTVLSFNLERRLFGLNPFVFHLNNLLLHLIITLLIFFFCQKIGLTERAAFFTALIFGIHPIHVESVAWITERKDLLYAFFYMLSLMAYWSFLQKKKRRFYIISLLCGLLSVLAKPMALSLPWILLLLNYLDEKKWSWKNIADKIPFFIVIESVSWITFSLNVRTAQVNWAEGPLIWIWTASFYIQKFLAPYPLSPLYILPEPVSAANPIYLRAILIMSLFLLSFFGLRKNRWWVFACLFYCGSTFFLWRFDRIDVSIVADRFMYLPCLGFCIFFGMSLDRLFTKFKTLVFQKLLSLAGLFLLISCLALATFNQSKIWKNNDTIWEDVMKKYPDSTIAYNNKGAMLSSKGDYAEAIKMFTKAIELNPKNKEAFYNVGFAATMLEQYDLGMDFFNKTIVLDPDYAKAYSNRGFIYFHVNQDADKALADYNKALELDPQLSNALLGRAIIYDRIKEDYDKALDDFNRSIAINNTNAEAYNYRGSLLGYIKGEYNKATQDFTKAIALDPSFTEAYLNRGYAFKKLNAFEKALNDITKAIDLSPQAFQGYINRGSLFREMNNFNESLNDYTKAIELEPNNTMGLFLRAELYTSLGKNVLALKDYNTILEKDPRNAKGFYLRSVTRNILNDPQQALKDAIKAKALDFPIDEGYLKNLQEATSALK